MLLFPFILSPLAASLPAVNVANVAPPSTNLSSTSLGEAHHRVVALRDNNASLYINYFDDARIPRHLLTSALFPAMRQAMDLVAVHGKDAVMLARHQWGLPGCWVYVDNWAQSPTKRMTYGILLETIKFLWEEKPGHEDITFVSYIDILEGTSRAGARIGEAVVEDIKPSNWDVTSGVKASSVATT